MKALAASLLLLLAGCASSPSGSDAPADPVADAATATEPPVEPGVPVQDPPAPTGPDVRRITGNLTFTQDAAIVCPVYLQSSGRSSTERVELTDATDFQMLFTWTPAVDAFRGARIGFAADGTTVLSELPDVVGASPLEWHLGAAELAELQDAGSLLLHIEGPYCMENSPPGQTGVAYTQTIQFDGNITYGTQPSSLLPGAPGHGR